MESPDRSESTVPAPVDPGSPFFKYLCGLSPIKPAKSVHVVQTYAELSLPPPPAVFTSPPPANFRRSGGGRSKRGIVVSRTASTHVTVEVVGHAWDSNAWGGGDDKENQLSNQSYMRKSYVAAQVDAAPQQNPSKSSSEYSSRQQQQHFWRLQVEQQHEETAAQVSADTPSKFEYGDVSDYLADPTEGGLYAAGSSSQLVTESEVHWSSQSPEEGDYGDHQEEAGGSLSAEHQGHAVCCDDATNAGQRSLNGIRRDSSASGCDHEGIGKGTEGEKSSCLDEEAARMAFLLVGDVDGDGGKNSSDWASHLDLSKFSRQHNPDFSATGTISNFSQLKTREDFQLATSKALENQRNAEAQAGDREPEDRKDVLVGGTSGQRGVRRRCLDFEASVRRKSLGNSSSRKRLGPRSEAPPGSSSAAAYASSLPPATLCERAIATSDATNSVVATSGAADSQSDVSFRPERASSASRVPSSGLLRISRSIMQSNADLMPSEQRSTDAIRLGRDGNNSSSSMGIPSGIGLHLNSLTGRISFSPTNRGLKQGMGITSIAKGAVASLLGTPGLVGSQNESWSEEYGNCALGVGAASNNFPMGLSPSNSGAGVVVVMERSRMTLLESLPVVDMSQGALQTNTMQSLADGGGQSLEGSQPSSADGLENQFASAETKRPLHQDVLQLTNAEEYDSPRSRQKRRKTSTGSGEKSGEGCKRCTCKKSKCLKLYCECFAAGTYCVGSCTCRDCFNKPEHEEIVMSTRRQIESRNPLAFAPKIVHSGESSSPKQQGEETIEAPASAHHKRGCNCKKSLCLKKYCECYQAGVGCSEGCRCEGCKNMYGRKEPTEDSDDVETSPNALETGSVGDELELAGPGFHTDVGTMDPHCNNGKELSPITPSFQYTGQGRAVERVRSAGKKRSSSPLSQLQYGPKPPRSPAFATRSAMKFQSNSGAQRTPELEHLSGVVSPASTPKLSRVNQQLSPRWDGLVDLCTLTPLPQPPLRPNPASISTLDRTGTSPAFSYQSIEPISSYQPDKLDSVSKISDPPFQQLSDHSPLSSCGLLNPQDAGNHSGRCTAALPTSTYLGVSNEKAEDVHSTDLCLLCEDDDTPDFLKYDDSTNLPAITKSGSPNQKRVSPPHFEGARDRNRDGRVVFESPTRSSSGLRRGRKFILQALP